MVEQKSPNRTIMPANNIIKLLWFCLNNTYFLFQDQFYEQTNRAAMGSPFSPTVANLYMGNLTHSHYKSREPTQDLEDLCWWYFCDPT